MNRRNFIKTAVAIGVVAALPMLPTGPYIDTAYPHGDIRRYGAREGIDCTFAVQAAIDDQVGRECCVYIPCGTWHMGGVVNGAWNGSAFELRGFHIAA